MCVDFPRGDIAQRTPPLEVCKAGVPGDAWLHSNRCYPLTFKESFPRDIAHSIPAALADVALIDARTSAAGGGMGVSWWYAKVAAGEAPQPVIRGPRCTRWKLVDVKGFWAEFAARGVDSQGAQQLPAQASKAKHGAQAPK